MLITAYFSTSGIGTGGLSPTITIVDAGADTIIINAASMTEITNASGWYKYDFTTFSDTTYYIITSNAGIDTVDDRYPTNSHREEELIEDGKTQPELIKIIAASTAGTASGAGTGTMTFKGLDGVTDRIVAEVDGDGNRDSVTLDAS